MENATATAADKLEEFYSSNIYDAQHRKNITYTIPRRYTRLTYISSGAQGSVISAYDNLKKRPVAIKKMHRPCCELRTAKLAYRELCHMTSIHHPNIIRLYDAFTPSKTVADFEELYFVMELMDYSLDSVLKNKQLSHKELSFIVYQLLCAVNHLHNSRVIHRDLKPSNVVINEDFTLKVLDFGLARNRTYDTASRMTAYVVTRYYRAPEVIFELPYDEKVDVWSVGCICAELLLHRVLFQGSSSIDQWVKIVSTLGTPSEEFLSQLPPPLGAFLRNMPLMPQRSMVEIIPDKAFVQRSEIAPNLTAEHCRDLLAHMLRINMADRFTVDECLKHPYVNVWFREEEVNQPASESRYDEDVEIQEMSLKEWKELLFTEVQAFQRQRSTSRSTLV